MGFPGKLIYKAMHIKKAVKRRLNRPDWGDLRSTEPVSRVFGFDRGRPVGRYYIEKFLEENRVLITGDLLEVADDGYIRRFGTDVKSYNVLHYTSDNKIATIVGDLSDSTTLPHESIDCFLCTQTLNFIYDFKSAVRGIHHLLRNGGTALVTLAGLVQVSRYDMDKWGDYWRFNTLSAYKIFAEIFGDENVSVRSYGNLLSAVSILEGISSDELTPDELDLVDEDYQVIVAVRARKVDG